MSSLAVIIPAYNEELTIRQVILDFHRACPDAAIVVVDNASTDDTNDIVRKTFAEITNSSDRQHLLFYEGSPRKAAAMRRAFTEIDADIYVMVGREPSLQHR